LEKLRKNYPGFRLWRQPTNITNTSSSASSWPQGAYILGTRCVYCKWRKHGATWPKSWKSARTDQPKKILGRFQPIPRRPVFVIGDAPAIVQRCLPWGHSGLLRVSGPHFNTSVRLPTQARPIARRWRQNAGQRRCPTRKLARRYSRLLPEVHLTVIPSALHR
jgi:hypothetical protein